MKTFKNYINESKKYDKLSEEEQLELIKENPYNIMYITNPSEEVQLEAVKQYNYTIRFISNPSEKVQFEAVKRDGYSIQFINNPSEKVQLEAVKQDGFSIFYISDPSEEVQLEAVKQNINNIFYIENPCTDIVFYCITNKPELLKIKGNPFISSKLPDNYFQNLSYEVQKRLVDYAPGFVLLIPNLDKKLRNSLNVVRDITGLI